MEILLSSFRISSLAFGLLCLVGCAGANSASSGTSQQVGPNINKQPADQSVPMGLTAQFSVATVGTSLTYQWSRNGTPIPGATAPTYATPATDFSDTGAIFTVTISNPLAKITSNPAKLTVTARAPLPGDLRFQQVDAPSTVNGYSIAFAQFGTYLDGNVGGVKGFGAATGTGLFLSNGPTLWQFTPFNLPSDSSGLSTGYMYDYLNDLQSTLSQPTILPGGAAVNAPNSVITSASFSVQPGFVGAPLTFALSYIQSTQSTGFDMSMQTVDPASFPAAATQEGLHGRVITAASFNAGKITFFSYGWAKDTSSTYDCKTVVATIDTATDAITSLAQQGYIVTATGSSLTEDGSSVVLVGTRLSGDTMQRPLLVKSPLTTHEIDDLLANGYAVVAVVQKLAANSLVIKNYIGER